MFGKYNNIATKSAKSVPKYSINTPATKGLITRAVLKFNAARADTELICFFWTNRGPIDNLIGWCAAVMMPIYIANNIKENGDIISINIEITVMSAAIIIPILVA